MPSQIIKILAQWPRTNLSKMSTCDMEPIHAPGQIQAHGILMVTSPGTNRISHVSANFERMSGLSAKHVLGAKLGAVVGEQANAAIEKLLESNSPTPSIVLHLNRGWSFSDPLLSPEFFTSTDLAEGLPDQEPSRGSRNSQDVAGAALRAGGCRRTMVAHSYLGRTFLEIETEDGLEERIYSLANAQKLLGSLSHCATTEELCDVTACNIRRLTDYDRVMVYRFDPDGNGRVMAEAKLDSLEPFLGLCYPATDIPQQARRLYLRQRVRAIPDIDYVPVGLLSNSNDDDFAPLDMSHCALRAVSPTHLEYCRNMGVRATLTASIIRDDELWGMIVCHHSQPRTASPDLRSLLETVSQLISLLIKQTDEACLLADKLRRYADLAKFPFSVNTNEDLATILANNGKALLGLVGASGALVRFGDQISLIGQTPQQAEAITIVDALRNGKLDDTLASDDCGIPGGVAASFAAFASGVLVLPILNNSNDFLAFFRPELVQFKHWAGDPTESKKPYDSSVPPSPRKSFAAWSEITRGCSVPWSATDLETAKELRRTIADFLLRQVEARFAQLAAYDPLTALANRRTIKSLIDDVHSRRTHARVAMLLFDLDRFKSINDTWGHEIGDQVLIQTAERLRQLTPHGATSGRLGGDEFVVLWPGASAAEAENLGKSLVSSLSKPFIFHKRRYNITASVGVAVRDSDVVEPLLREADEAMYTAKKNGGGQVIVFDTGLHERNVNDAIIEQDLFDAIQHNEMEVHYQPIVRIADRSISGFEALVRWHHPVRGWIPPSDFIPRAEANGVIIPLGEFVFATAVNNLARWCGRNKALTMSVNVSARQLKEASFTTYATNVLAEANVSPSVILIEVTESTMADGAAVRELHKLRAAGFKVGVDDFGTGYSSLSYLQVLPVDYAKIDRAFVQRLGSDERATNFFISIVALCHTLDLRTIAEGCETEAQWQALSSAGCDAVQGWLISKARPASDIDEMLT